MLCCPADTTQSRMLILLRTLLLSPREDPIVHDIELFYFSERSKRRDLSEVPSLNDENIAETRLSTVRWPD